MPPEGAVPVPVVATPEEEEAVGEEVFEGFWEYIKVAWSTK